MLGAFQLTTANIADIVAMVLVFAATLIFFLWKKSVKLLFLYLAVQALFFAVIVLDEMFSVPVARAVAEVLVWFMLVALAVVYSSDLKVIFFKLTKFFDKSAVTDATLSDEELRETADEIVKACQSMSKSRTGALIVIAPTSVAAHILDTGVKLEAYVSAVLLEAIFNTHAQFHDGAVIIKGNKALAAGCFLPLSQSQTVAKNLGTRHRAGIGITEESDMLTIIVSEETGIISIAKRGELRRYVTPDRLRDILHETFKIAAPTRTRSLNA